MLFYYYREFPEKHFLTKIKNSKSIRIDRSSRRHSVIAVDSNEPFYSPIYETFRAFLKLIRTKHPAKSIFRRHTTTTAFLVALLYYIPIVYRLRNLSCSNNIIFLSAHLFVLRFNYFFKFLFNIYFYFRYES